MRIDRRRLKEPGRRVIHYRTAKFTSADHGTVLGVSFVILALAVAAGWLTRDAPAVFLAAPIALGIGAVALALLSARLKRDGWALHFWVDADSLYVALANRARHCKKATLIRNENVIGLTWFSPDGDRPGSFVVYNTQGRPLEIPVSLVSIEEAKEIARVAFPQLTLEFK